MVLESEAVSSLFYFFLARPECFKSCYEYYINNVPPSTLSRREGLNKLVVRGCISRVKSKNSGKVVHLLKLLRNINPADILMTFTDGDRYYKCIWCGAKYSKRKLRAFTIHISRKHAYELEKLINDVLTVVL